MQIRASRQGHVDLERFRRRCRVAGITATTQRRVIYEVLAESDDHPHAEAVYSRVKERMPRVSLGTVYRNLRLFVQTGLIDEVATAQSMVRFDANPSRHHHLICTRCRRVSDTYSAEFDALGGRVDGNEGFEVHDVKVNVYGVCSRCRQHAGSTAGPASTRAGSEQDSAPETKER